MPHYFVPPENISEGFFFLKGPEAAHIARVARHKVSDLIEIFDGQGRKYLARIDRIAGGRELEGTLLSELPEPAPRRELWLYAAMIHRDRFEAVLEKGAEIGVSKFCPILTSRTEIKLRHENKRAKLERWSSVVLAACKQSGRARLPRIDPPLTIEKALDALRGTPTVIAWEREKSCGLERALAAASAASNDPALSRVNLLIGPEGGFSEEEVQAAVSAGAVPFTLGPHVLRAETAALVASALILHQPEPVTQG